MCPSPTGLAVAGQPAARTLLLIDGCTPHHMPGKIAPFTEQQSSTSTPTSTRIDVSGKPTSSPIPVDEQAAAAPENPTATRTSAVVVPIYNSFDLDDEASTLTDEDFHQATVVLLANEGVPWRWKLWYAGGSLLIVLVQVCAATALIASVAAQRCGQTWQSCDSGQWCFDGTGAGLPHPMCLPCGGSIPAFTPGRDDDDTIANATHFSWSTFGASSLYETLLNAETLSGARAALPDLCTRGYGLLAGECNSCYSTSTNVFTTRSDVLWGRVRQATVFDWAMLLLCTLLVASQVNREMREIRTVRCLVYQFCIEAPPKSPSPWLLVCLEATTLRHCCVVSVVISTVPIFALGMGMDALSVALNALAVLFILELDNHAYALLLSSRQQEFFGSFVCQFPAKYHPGSKREAAIDVICTFVAVVAPILVNFFVARGAGRGFNALTDVFGTSVGFFVIVTLIPSCMATMTETRMTMSQRVAGVIFSAGNVSLHLFLMFQLFLLATSV